jgi:hypothetical protein
MLEVWRALPPLARVGLAAIAAGTVGDVVSHGLVFGPQHLAHATILAGMVLVLLGVLADGVSRSRDPLASDI